MKHAISLNEFYREFREHVRDPILGRKPAKSSEEVEQLIDLLDNELPKQIYESVIEMEKSRKPGISKFVSVIVMLHRWLDRKHLGWLVPFITPLIELSIRLIYRKYFEEFFDKHGLEDMLELLVGMKLSSNDDEELTESAEPV